MATDIAELREVYTYHSDQWRHIREEAQTDMRCVAGDPWDPTDRQLREDAKRPVLSLDELNQYVNQAINDVRQNKRAIRVAPDGSGATDKRAERRGNLIRQIEYRSNAQMAYTTMYENAIQRSYGFLRIVPQWPHLKSWDQELRIVPVMNPDLLTPDADGVSVDGSDWKNCFVGEWWNKKELARKYRGAKPVSFEGFPELSSIAATWERGDRVLIVERWYVYTKPRKLLLVQPPAPPAIPMSLRLPEAPRPVSLFEDEFLGSPLSSQRGVTVLRDRIVEYPYVKQCIANGVEILEERDDYKGRSLPFVSCYGKVIYVDRGAGPKREILSMVRLARDPYMLYCYIRSCEAEIVGAVPRNSWRAYEGQLDGHEDEWERAAHEPVAVLYAKPSLPGLPASQVLPLPTRESWDPPLQNLDLCAEAARRAIQAAMGITPLPTAAQRRNEKSGVALQKIDESAQKGSYHFVDHYDSALTRTGAILDELLPHYYDAMREVTVRNAQEQPEVITINNPAEPDSQIADEGRYDVTIGVGPKLDSEREAATQFADTLISSPLLQLLGPEKAQQIIAMAIRLRNVGPIGDEMADTISPQKPEEGEPPSPEMVAQLQAQFQEAVKQLQAMQQALETEQAKQQAQIEAARIKAEADVQQERIRADMQVRIAAMTAGVKSADVQAKAASVVLKTGMESMEAEKDREHEAAMEVLKQSGQLTLGAQKGEQAERSQFAKQTQKT